MSESNPSQGVRRKSEPQRREEHRGTSQEKSIVEFPLSAFSSFFAPQRFLVSALPHSAAQIVPLRSLCSSHLCGLYGSAVFIPFLRDSSKVASECSSLNP